MIDPSLQPALQSNTEDNNNNNNNNNRPKSKDQWDNLPFEKVIGEIGNNLLRPEFSNFSENLNSKIKSVMEKFISQEEEDLTDDFLSNLINQIIESDPKLFEQLKETIGVIFDENQQFVIPQ